MSLAFHVRPAVPDDLPFLWDMLTEAGNWRGERNTSAEDIRADDHDARYLEDWGRPTDLGVIAEDVQGRPLGAAWYRLLPAERPGFGFADDSTPELAIGVLPEHRGCGTGTALLTELIRASSAFLRWP